MGWPFVCPRLEALAAKVAVYFPSREMETLGKERPCKELMASKDMHALGWKWRLEMEFPMSPCEGPTHWGLTSSPKTPPVCR